MMVIWLYLYSEKVVPQGINDYKNITEFSGQNTPSVIPPMFAPNNMDFIIAQMSGFGY